MKSKKTTKEQKKVKSKKIIDLGTKEITGTDKGFEIKGGNLEQKPIILKSGICIICNDPVNNEAAVYDKPCHKECYNASGDKMVLRRIKELSNG